MLISYSVMSYEPHDGTRLVHGPAGRMAHRPSPSCRWPVEACLSLPVVVRLRPADGHTEQAPHHARPSDSARRCPVRRRAAPAGWRRPRRRAGSPRRRANAVAMTRISGHHRSGLLSRSGGAWCGEGEGACPVAGLAAGTPTGGAAAGPGVVAPPGHPGVALAAQPARDARRLRRTGRTGAGRRRVASDEGMVHVVVLFTRCVPPRIGRRTMQNAPECQDAVTTRQDRD